MDSPSDTAKPRRRDYEKILTPLEGRWKRRPTDRAKIMQDIVDAIWDGLGGKVVSWCGFYLLSADGQSLALGPHKDKPACASIGTHGVCGHAVSERKTQIVPDVRALGDAHIECDPANQAEIAVPVMDLDGKVFAVLDLDSTQAGAFGEEDRRWLERLVRTLGQTPPAERQG